MDNFDLKDPMIYGLKYKRILEEKQIPIIMTEKHNYNISPLAVKHLEFEENSMKFIAWFKGCKTTIRIFYSDIIDITNQNLEE